jgi:hypothetical protein
LELWRHLCEEEKGKQTSSTNTPRTNSPSDNSKESFSSNRNNSALEERSSDMNRMEFEKSVADEEGSHFKQPLLPPVFQIPLTLSSSTNSLCKENNTSL